MKKKQQPVTKSPALAAHAAKRGRADALARIPEPEDTEALAEKIVIMNALLRPSGKGRIPLQLQVARGIHEQPFHTFDGSLVLVAVSAMGREVGRVVVNRLSDYDSARRFLEDALLRIDPPPRIAAPDSLALVS